MRNLFLTSTVAAALIGTALCASPAFAGRSRTPMDVARTQLHNLHGRLTHAALTAAEVEAAHQEAGRSFAVLYQIKENVLADVRQREDYGDLRLALWHRQQQLAGLHVAVPVRISNILASASDSMTLRRQINRIEAEALEASDAYVAARDDLNGKVAARQRAIATALDGVRTHPEFMAMCQQVQTMRNAATGRGSHVMR